MVQIQFNYADYNDPAVQSGQVYEVCRKFNKPVIVMEPVEGGSLVNLPEKAMKVFQDLGPASPASYAIRFAAGFEGMMMVLSGMSSLEQVRDNISYMQDFQPLSEKELAAVEKVQEIFHSIAPTATPVPRGWTSPSSTNTTTWPGPGTPWRRRGRRPRGSGGDARGGGRKSGQRDGAVFIASSFYHSLCRKNTG